MVETAARAGVEAVATSVSNPRVELEDHYYNAQHSSLIELGLHPTLLTDTVLDEMFGTVHKQSSQINSGLFPPSIKWAANKGD